MKVQAHPPERSRRPTIIASACCTTCCCCSCCLHSVGGLIGAVKASNKASAELGDSASRAANIYWLTFAIVLAIAVVINIWIVLLGTPIIQLLASLIAFIIVLLSAKNFPNPAHARQTVGRITGRTLLGAFIGLLIMLPFVLIFLQ